MRRLSALFLAAFVGVMGGPASAAEQASPAAGSSLASTEGQFKTKDALEAVKQKEAKAKKKEYKLEKLELIDKELEPKTRSLKGQVVLAVRNGMSVEFERDKETGAATELWVDFKSGMKLSGAKDFSAFAPGDTVEVTVQESKDKTRRVATGVSLVRKLTDEERRLRAAEEAGPDEPAGPEEAS